MNQPNTIQEILDSKEDEIKMVQTIIDHPAGFIVDLFGKMLYIRTTESNWEVTWEMLLDEQIVDSYKAFTSSEEAVRFFVEKRHELQLGIDFEIALWKERMAKEQA